MKKSVLKVLTLVLTVVMVMALTACGTANTNPASVDSGSSDAAVSAGDFTLVEAGKLHMATNAAFPPYEMVADDGTYEGIDVEIATKIAENLGLELVVDDMEFNSVLTSVQGGKSDIAMAGLTVNEERKKNVDFTASYAKGVQVIIVKEDSPIQTAEDLANASTIGCQQGTTGSIYCSDDFGEDHVNDYTNGALAVQALMNGQVDAVVIDSQPAKEFVAANTGLKILETAYTEEDYAIGINKENTALRDAIDAELQSMIADGTVQEILDKYINADAE